MRLRTQLALAFLLLTVLPLGGIVLYSYVSSEKAFRQAVWAESEVLAGEIETRLASTRTEIRDRIARLGDLALAAPGAPSGDLGQVAQRLRGAELPYVESVELVPMAGEKRAPWVVYLGTSPVPAPAPSAAPVPPAPQAPRAPSLLPRLQGVPTEEEIVEVTRRALATNDKALAELVKLRVELSPEEREALRKSRQESEKVLGELDVPIRSRQETVGKVRAHVKAHSLLTGIFSGLRREQGEMPFAVDQQGSLYVLQKEDREKLRGVPLTCPAPHEVADWVVVSRKDPASGLCYGVARPIRQSLGEMRRTALRNFGYGLGLVALCFAGIFPLSGRITRNLKSLMHGVEALAQGDLDARVPVRSRDEFGRLAEAFNRMAADLSDHQARLLEQELGRRLLEAEHARKSDELEEARRFQLSLLPRDLPQRDGLEIAVHTRTATEVGGDYYDFLSLDDGALTVAVGDATGHGAAAGTMVTVVKGLFTARAGEVSPARFLAHANDVIRRMHLGRMAMALTVLRLDGRRLAVSAAGMPPVLVHRAASGKVEEACLRATPLGAMAEPAYEELTLDLEAGDTVLLMTDGLPELLGGVGDEGGEGEPLGYPRVLELFASAAGGSPEEVIRHLTAAGEAWSQGRSLSDDMTFVVLRAR